jgi:hypothetical protein
VQDCGCYSKGKRWLEYAADGSDARTSALRILGSQNPHKAAAQVGAVVVVQAVIKEAVQGETR